MVVQATVQNGVAVPMASALPEARSDDYRAQHR